ncbi:MAG: hypothetical protein QM831_05410 [Kofleriaceae bacterium]
MKRSLIVVSALFVGCVDSGEPADDVAELDQASTVLNDCAVAKAANATGVVGPLAASDSYGRQPVKSNRDPMVGGCGCTDWQAIYDSQGQAAADAAVPKCRPYIIFQVQNTSTTQLVKFHVDSELTDLFLNDPVGCSQSSVHMEIWKNTGGTQYQQVWENTLTPTYSGGACAIHNMGVYSPAEPAGLYRVRAVANVPGEQGYGGVVIKAALQ